MTTYLVTPPLQAYRQVGPLFVFRQDLLEGSKKYVGMVILKDHGGSHTESAHPVSSTLDTCKGQAVSYTMKPVLKDHCHERPPVLKDYDFLTEGPIFQCK